MPDLKLSSKSPLAQGGCECWYVEKKRDVEQEKFKDPVKNLDISGASTSYRELDLC